MANSVVAGWAALAFSLYVDHARLLIFLQLLLDREETFLEARNSKLVCAGNFIG